MLRRKRAEISNQQAPNFVENATCFLRMLGIIPFVISGSEWDYSGSASPNVPRLHSDLLLFIMAPFVLQHPIVRNPQRTNLAWPKSRPHQSHVKMAESGEFEACEPKALSASTKIVKPLGMLSLPINYSDSAEESLLSYSGDDVRIPRQVSQ